MNGLQALDYLLDKQDKLEKYGTSGTISVSKQRECLNALEKELKVLNIVRRKGLSTNELWFIKNDKSFEEYTETLKELYWGDETLDKRLKTEDEFKLLREVFYEPVGKV